jgi:hypothetical protein
MNIYQRIYAFRNPNFTLGQNDNPKEICSKEANQQQKPIQKDKNY